MEVTSLNTEAEVSATTRSRADGTVKRVAIVVLSLVFAGLAACSDETLRYGPGVTAPKPPQQLPLPAVARDVDGFRLTEQASYSLTGKLLSKRRYRWDELADIAPWDFAVAWGELSDEAVLAGTRVVQGARLMYWHLYGKPLPLDLVEESSANVHMVPSTEAIEAQLAEIPRGAVFTAEGRLVDVRLPDGRTVLTSLTRRDRGVGACEILLVESVNWKRPEAP